MSQRVHEVTDSSFEREVLQGNKPVLVDFWAEWCGPCRMLAPTVDAIAEEQSNVISVVKLNVDTIRQPQPPTESRASLP
ncbi:MAG TPA: thioredoxin domain-containing protein [Pyrinomonadaceae bacterium]|jgi:thioredoxin 1|nr:thioredoxin domain-containing protein [Pyrinomonadaceae bacterium]